MSPGYVLLVALAAFYLGLRVQKSAKDAEIRMLWAIIVASVAEEQGPSELERYAAEKAARQ